MPHFFFQRVESASVASGIPDLHYCASGAAGWLELKATSGWAVEIAPAQVAWAEAYARHGGRVFLTVRRYCTTGPRRIAADELWLYRAPLVRTVMVGGLKAEIPTLYLTGGPSRWNWLLIEQLLCG